MSTFNLSRFRKCDACTGTGEPSPWEWDHYVWRSRIPHAVCGSCRGSGLLTRWGFRLSAKVAAEMRAWLEANPAELCEMMRNGWTPEGAPRGAYIGETSASNRQ
jgi:hypothetical protein